MLERVVLLSGDRDLAAGRPGPFAATLRGLAAQLALPITALVVADAGSRPAFDLVPGVRIVPLDGRGGARRRQLSAALLDAVGAPASTLAVSHEYGRCLGGRATQPLAAVGALAGWVAEVHHLPGRPFGCGPRGVLERRLIEGWIRRSHRLVTRYRCVERHLVPARLRALGVSAEKIAVVPSVYLDLEKFAPGPVNAAPIDLLWVGRWSAEKGIRFVRPLLRRLAGAGALRVEGLGRGVERGLARAARDLKGVAVHARASVEEPELIELYRRARVLLCPSLCEGGPRVVAEALACGTPVVATAVGRIPDWIRAPRCGCIAAPRVADLAAAVLRVWEQGADPRQVRSAAQAQLRDCERGRALAAYAKFLREAAG